MQKRPILQCQKVEIAKITFFAIHMKGVIIMSYIPLNEVYYKDNSHWEAEYISRYNNQFAKHLDLTVKQFKWNKEYKLFYCYPEDIVTLQDKIMFESNALNRVFDSVPKVGITQFLLSCLIAEIKASNDIEGVRSTRKEIREALSSQDKPNPDKRLWGIVNKYSKIITGETVKLEKPEDIRALYDEFILLEIKKDNPENVPDGMLFRKDSVDVVTSSGKSIHRGIFPETKIITYLEETLKILHDPVIPALFRIAIFHYLFGYIHPFYDGNGRTVRFITSSLLASVINPSVALRLSVLIKQHKKEYYALFENTNSAINCGDLTPFILWSLRFVLLSITSTKDILLTRKKSFIVLEQRLKDILSIDDKILQEVYYILLQAAVFSDIGVTLNDIVRETHRAQRTIYSKINSIPKEHLIINKQIRPYFYRLNLKMLK